ncbi:unnamed protein product, partial [Ectocarpus sp. 12 AP-2014]
GDLPELSCVETMRHAESARLGQEHMRMHVRRLHVILVPHRLVGVVRGPVLQQAALLMRPGPASRSHGNESIPRPN